MDSFCRYQEALNDPDENSAGHWDLAIYMTGLDLWSKEGAFNTLGLAHTGGMCKPAYSCLVTEFGTRKNHAHNLNNGFDSDGKLNTEQHGQYPSAGFGAAFILAHEIGHSLGMRHDDHQGCLKVKDEILKMQDWRNKGDTGAYAP